MDEKDLKKLEEQLLKEVEHFTGKKVRPLTEEQKSASRASLKEWIATERPFKRVTDTSLDRSG